MKKSPCYGYLAVERDTPAPRGHYFWGVGTFCPTQPPWTTLSGGGQVESPPPGWRESPGRLQRTWGNIAARSRTGLCSSSPYLALGTAAEGARGEVGPGGQANPPPHPYRPGSARWPRPPLAYLV